MTKQIVLAAAVAALGLTATIASAQATRTWVSGVGDDANPCSRTAPCKTFAGTISKTAAGGEINCLDPGGFGGVTITKALSIICQFTEAGVLVSGTNAIIVNAGPNDNVYLRGLDIEGLGTGLSGIVFFAGASLTVEESMIRAFRGTNGAGISFEPSGTSRLTVSNTTINSNLSGIVIEPSGAGGNARVELDNVRLLNNTNSSIRADTSGGTSGSGVQVLVTNSHLYNSANGITVVASPTSPAQANIFNSRIFNNQPGSALVANGNFAFIRAGENVIIGNGAAVQVLNGGTVRSVGNNVVDGNSNASSFSPPNIIPQ